MTGALLPLTPLDRGATGSAPSGRATGEQRAAWPTVLVSMPFMGVDRPSIQIGLLKGVLGAHRFPVRTLHANLDFAAHIGADVYRLLCKRQERALGDWLFSVEAFGDDAPDPEGRLVDEVADAVPGFGDDPHDRRTRLLRLRRHDVPAYLDALLESEPWDAARLVGFSSTFQQNAASIALARRLKQRFPHLMTIFGGANFDGDMGAEWVRAVDCIDAAVVGEGDVAFPALLDALAVGADPSAVPGVVCRVDGAVVSTPPGPPVRRLDDLPSPDYDEYFVRAERLGLLTPAGQRRVRIPFESARGCWWGAKHHCTFCGLNGSTMQFRAKSPGRVAEELAGLARRYRTFRFEAVDNILDLTYLTELLPRLINEGTSYDVFYEIKANLTRAQVRLLAQAGVLHIQPGIESLSSGVLRLMRKGIRAAQNVNLLRWGAYYGVRVSWNILYGFPGESADDYAEQIAAIPHLVHLRPPNSAGRLWLERFSPLFTGAAPGIGTRAPERSYGYVYPAGVDLERVAYFFEYELAGDRLPESTYADLHEAIDKWTAAWERDEPPVLTYWTAPGFLQIYDGRSAGAEGTFTFHDELADIYLACVDRPTTVAAIHQRLGGRSALEAVEEAVHEFHRRGLVFRDGSLVLALALPAGPIR